MTKQTDTFRIPKKKRVKLITPRSVYTKFTLIFTFCYTAAFAVGCLLFHLTGGAANAQFDRRIAGYFAGSLADCTDAFAFARRLLSLSAEDLTRLGFLFMAGFTVFVAFAEAGILLFRGLSFGFSVSYLASMLRREAFPLSNPTLSLILFSLSGALCTALMIHLSAQTVLFSDAFKALCGRPRLILRSRALYAQLFRFTVAFGAILLLTLLRCAL